MFNFKNFFKKSKNINQFEYKKNYTKNNIIDINKIYNKDYISCNITNQNITDQKTEQKKHYYFFEFKWIRYALSNDKKICNLYEVKTEILQKYAKKEGFIAMIMRFFCSNALLFEFYYSLYLQIICFIIYYLIYYFIVYIFIKYIYVVQFFTFYYALYKMTAIRICAMIEHAIQFALINSGFFFWIEICLTLFLLVFLIFLIFQFFYLRYYDLFVWKSFNNCKYIYNIFIIFIICLLSFQLLLVMPSLLTFFYVTNKSLLICFSGDFYISFLNTFLKTIILLTFLWWLCTVVTYIKDDLSIYYSLFLITLTTISIIVSLIMISTSNLIIIYLTMEIQSLCFYVLAAWNDQFEAKGSEASLKYLFLGGFSSNLFLFGIALVYSSFGTIRFFEIIDIFFMNSFVYDPVAYIGFCFLTFGILFKLALVPFHFWIADVYEGSHWLVVAFFAVVPKLPYLFLLLQLWVYVFNIFHYIIYLKEIWIFLSIISIIYGCAFMLYASNLGRIAAYSSIINMGFIFFAMACSWNIKFILFYLFAYLFQLFLFFVIIVISRVSYLHELQDLYHKNSFLAFALTIALFSLMGIPPFAGFCAKILIINSFIFNGELFLSFIFVFLSVISAVPYLRLIRLIYSFVGKRTLKNITFNNKFKYWDMLFLNILLFLNIFFFFFIDLILTYISIII